MVKKPNLASTVFGGSGKDKLATADVYNDTVGTDDTLSGFQSTVSKSADRVGDLVKNSGMNATDLADLVDLTGGVGIDTDALSRRLSGLTGYRFDSMSEFAMSIKEDALGAIDSWTGLELNGLVDTAGKFYPLINGDVRDARELFGVIGDVLGDEYINKFVDLGAQAGFFGSLISKCIEFGIPDAIDVLFSKIEDEEMRKEMLIQNLDRAARSGDVETLNLIKDLIGPKEMVARCPEIVEFVLSGYRIRDRTDAPDYWAHYNKIVALFNELDPKWCRDSAGPIHPTITKLAPFTTASEVSIEIFTRVGDYKTEALIAKSYPLSTMRATAKQQWPLIAL